MIKKALFVGNTYLDITLDTVAIPLGDNKLRDQKYAVNLGGNATVAGCTVSRLGQTAEIVTPIANDELNVLIQELYKKEDIKIHPINSNKSSLSVIIPNGIQRAIILCGEKDIDTTTPQIDMSEFDIIHFDGHMPEITLELAKQAKKAGVLTSLDGGTIRPGTQELLEYIDVAVVSEQFCQDLKLAHKDALNYLHTKGCKVAAITRGIRGVIGLEDGEFFKIPAMSEVTVKDSTGAGDIFHGAYVSNYLKNKQNSFKSHFEYANIVAGLAVQRLGTVSSIPSLDEIEQQKIID
jgi:sugar/nucleoside kinase (ribokinase family)